MLALGQGIVVGVGERGPLDHRGDSRRRHHGRRKRTPALYEAGDRHVPGLPLQRQQPGPRAARLVGPSGSGFGQSRARVAHLRSEPAHAHHLVPRVGQAQPAVR